ncbi:hypothetical protein [Oceanobacillus timonensis]|uniref:hypothetical protein n=1 Tax=Oceanobacillus timonensis TaxID=1926285 RepID=UPI0009BC6057|nr:hypothetical protein [Oceanobacillus timonensis]
MEIIKAIAPLIIVGGIAVFVVNRAKYKFNQSSPEKKKSKEKQDVSISFIPIGMFFGCAAGVILGTFSSIFLPTTISLGAGIGYLLGYFAYEFYNKEETVNHQ